MECTKTRLCAICKSARGRDKSVHVSTGACVWKVKHATSPKAILGHMPRWQQTVKTVTRTEDSVKQFGTQRV